MGKTKELAATLIRADRETLDFFILAWSEFNITDESPKELAESVQSNFQIYCTEDDVVRCFSTQIEESDVKCQMKNLNLYQ